MAALTERTWTKAALLLAGILLSTAALARGPGEECDPGAAPPWTGLICAPAFLDPLDGDGQPHGEWRIEPKAFINARKGDAVMSRGCGVVAGLMQNVEPKQEFDHVGIMAEDFYTVRHSTSIDDWYADFPHRESNTYAIPFTSRVDCAFVDGFDEQALKFGWPGSITHEVEGAVEGSLWTWTDPKRADNPCSPEPARTYVKAGFQPADGCDAADGVELGPHMVVQPPADLDDPALRAELNRVAEVARGLDVHYRFYHYTDAAQGFEAPGDRGWAAGTDGTECASFVRKAFMEAGGFTLEGPLEESDCRWVEVSEDAPCAAGQRLPPAQDGLYRYRADERAQAAGFLRKALEKMLEDKYSEGGIAVELIGWLENGATDAANQMTNCFAFDWCGESQAMPLVRTLRSEDTPAALECATEQDPERPQAVDARMRTCWQSPFEGVTVSPDDILMWDPPAADIASGGPYGSTDELHIVDSAYRQIHRWTAAADRGTIRGTVRFENDPALAARGTVIEGGGVLTEVPENARAFELVGLLPGAPVVLQACQRAPGDRWYAGFTSVDVAGGQTVEGVEITLEELPAGERCQILPAGALQRQITLSGSLTILDGEFIVSDEVATVIIGPGDDHTEAAEPPGPGGASALPKRTGRLRPDPLAATDADRTLILSPLAGQRKGSLHFTAKCVGGEVTADARLDLELRLGGGERPAYLEGQLTVQLWEGSTKDCRASADGKEKISNEQTLFARFDAGPITGDGPVVFPMGPQFVRQFSCPANSQRCEPTSLSDVVGGTVRSAEWDDNSEIFLNLRLTHAPAP